MDFEQLTKVRQSCRSYDADRRVEDEKIAKLVEAAKIAPSAMNAQPYDVWVVCSPEKDQAIRDAKSSFNGFIDNVNLFIVFTDAPYSNGKLEGLAEEMQIDYRTQDIGESIAYLTLQAKDLGLDTCILGGFRIDQVKKA
jgi:nitroreductase